MNDADANLQAISHLYGSNFVEFGAQARTLGWNSEHEQRLRFDVLTRHMDVSQPLHLIDYGCGIGDLLFYLMEIKNAHVARYTGYEINASIADVAARRLRSSNISGLISNSSVVEHTADWAIISGTFNVRLSQSPQAWETHLRQALRTIFSRTTIGLSFNLLSTYVDWQVDDLYYGDPLSFFDFCKTELSARVSLDHDYPLYEWTITALH
jgi:hypothetical protein